MDVLGSNGVVTWAVLRNETKQYFDCYVWVMLGFAMLNTADVTWMYNGQKGKIIKANFI